VKDVNKAASLMGRKSAEARKKKWGKKEFVSKMQEWGRLAADRRPVAKQNRRRGESWESTSVEKCTGTSL
jgi:hypothetical protein